MNSLYSMVKYWHDLHPDISNDTMWELVRPEFMEDNPQWLRKTINAYLNRFRRELNQRFQHLTLQ